MNTVAEVLKAWYRLVGTESGDIALTEQGESADEVAYFSLTRGCWAAQRWMLKQGYNGWRKRTSAISWSGTDAANGGKYYALPADFLRAYGNRDGISCLTEADGTRWGEETKDELSKGGGYYFKGDELWLCREASPPSTIYLDYHYTHPEWTSLVTIDFPTEALPLVVAEAADSAKEEDWYNGGAEGYQKIANALKRARAEALDIARLSKAARRFQKPRRYGNHW